MTDSIIMLFMGVTIFILGLGTGVGVTFLTFRTGYSVFSDIIMRSIGWTITEDDDEGGSGDEPINPEDPALQKGNSILRKWK